MKAQNTTVPFRSETVFHLSDRLLKKFAPPQAFKGSAFLLFKDKRKKEKPS